MACFKGILWYIYAYICINLLYLYIFFIFAHQFSSNQEIQHFFQGMLVKSQFLEGNKASHLTETTVVLGSALGQVSYTFGFLALPLPLGVDRLGDRPPPGMIPEPLSFVQSVHRPRCQGDKGEISWRDVTYGAEAGCFGRRERIYREATGLQVCVCHFLGQGGNKRELEAKFEHFFDDFFE